MAPASAEELLASNEQARKAQLAVNLATGGVEPVMKPVYSSKFGVPLGTPLRMPDVALPVSAERTCAGVAPGFCWRYNATAPVTCGVAIDVPLMVFVAVLLPIHADVMPTPGALMCTQLPKFEKNANRSEMSVAPTVMPFGTLDGDDWHASAVLFPAATAKTTPAAIAFCTD